ncbi:hypothetical protein ACQKP1_02890 [Allorhizobium sp. NPDC080224]|jgi:hypothetical protein|uniref:DUF2188 domain-containing protein n=1 Tax=Rhizobium rosettiformans TaxID=1368430 RepID=A0ABX7ETU6_9HYPH|nr:hypothetical protein [Rhizobium rosettiformans]QRF51747.1 hypothetical protein D4A92_10025 [Rhizobium rosettiformans]
MTEVYCDIIPQANGWCFLSEEGQSAVYPSYRLAVEAAREYSASKVSIRKVTVLRQQDLRGRMQEIAGIAQAWGPDGTTGMGGRA